MRTLPADYLERAYAAVLGKLIGVYLGRPFENWTYQRIVRELGPIEYYVHERLDCPLIVTDDDIAGTFTFIRALEDHGASRISSREIGETWLNYIVERARSCGGAATATRPSIPPGSISSAGSKRRRADRSRSTAGRRRTDRRADFHRRLGDRRAGDPALAARLAEQAARVSHDGAAVDAAKLWAAMEAEAFVSRDVDHLIDVGLAQIRRRQPDRQADRRHSRLAAAISGLARHAHQIEAHYGYDKYPGNCHVVPNHALMIMAAALRARRFLARPDDRLHLRLGHGLQRRQCRLPDGRDARPRGDRRRVGTGAGRRRPHADLLRRRRRRDQRRRAGQPTGSSTSAASSPACPPAKPPPKGGAQFHFSLPGSVQGFRLSRRPT
jgi:hypothetical protein